MRLILNRASGRGVGQHHVHGFGRVLRVELHQARRLGDRRRVLFGPEPVGLQQKAFYDNEFLPAYKQLSGRRRFPRSTRTPTTRNLLAAAIDKAAVKNADGSSRSPGTRSGMPCRGRPT
jgi:hypothetical protein